MWIFLEERGIEMVLSHPSKTRIIAEAKIKTDKIGEIERFPGYKELGSFAGLVPRVHQSGKGRECLVEMDNHTGSASSSKISWRAKKI